MLQNDPHCQILALAIQSNRTVTVRYKDKDRIIEPHAVGTDKDGNALVRAYQPESYDDSAAGWKLMRVDRIQQITYCANPSQAPRPGYKQGDKAMFIIEAQIHA